MFADSEHFPVHWLVYMGKIKGRYKRMAIVWALNFLFKDYRMLPTVAENVFNRYYESYPLAALKSMLDWIKSPVGSDKFRPVTADRLTRELADSFTSYLRKNRGVAEGRGIALLQYLRARYHSAGTNEKGLVRVAELMVMLSPRMKFHKDAVEDTSRYNWFMAMHLLYGYGNGQMSLRDLEHLYRLFPGYSGSVPFHNNHDTLDRLVTVGREKLALTAKDTRDVVMSVSFTNANYALPLYSLLRSLRKSGHPMAAYVIKIMTF